MRMGGISGKILKTTVFAVLFIILAGCGFEDRFNADALADKPIKISAWLAYWDLEKGAEELDKIGGKLEKLSYFGAYFDKDDNIFIPQELSNMKNKAKNEKKKYKTYLTFVNDKQNADMSFELKDTEVLRRLFADDESMDAHIDQVVKLALEGGYDGVEIDYEQIWKDEKIGRSFLLFTDKLYLQALKNNLALRIVLEPGAPFSAAYFTKGPEYVVMFYNLYGLHSSPGPKANEGFIEKMLTRMKALPGEKSAAFATGGCLWGDNGEKRMLSEEEARVLLTKYDADAQRDKESQCVFFAYEDGGVAYQVWYADAKTLNYWISIVREEEVNNISLWRLGGNADTNKIG